MRYVQHVWGPYTYGFDLAGLSANVAFPHRAQHAHLAPIHPVAQRQVSHRRLFVQRSYIHGSRIHRLSQSSVSQPPSHR